MVPIMSRLVPSVEYFLAKFLKKKFNNENNKDHKIIILYPPIEICQINYLGE